MSVPWVFRRDFSSCWLSLPSLTGLSSESQVAAARRFDPSECRGAPSLPSPKGLRRGDLPPDVPTDEGSGEKAYTQSRLDTPDCAAVAVISDSERRTRRDLLLLRLGSALGMAGTLIVEGVLLAFGVRR
jgi:hypothetical protein